MPFKDTAIFALVMIFMGLLLSLGVIILGVIASFFTGRKRPPETEIGGH